MAYRLQKINELIKQELGKILLHEEDFGPEILVTLLETETSADGLHANVFFSVYPTSAGEKIKKILEADVFKLQQLLNKRLKTHPVPKIRFAIDDSEAESEKIETIIRQEKN